MGVYLKADGFHEMLLSALLEKQQIINLVWVLHFCSLYQYEVKGLGSFEWKWLFSAIYFSFVPCILTVVLGNRQDWVCENEEQTQDESMICVGHWLSLSASRCGAAEPGSFLSESEAGCGPACTGMNQHRAGRSPVPCAALGCCHIPPPHSSSPGAQRLCTEVPGTASGMRGNQVSQIPIFSWKFPSCVRSLSNSEHPRSLHAFSNHISKN